MRNKLIHLYPFTVLLLGMITTQVLATVHVYLSNSELYNSLIAIKDAGYLIVPNQNVMASLKRFGPAFCGGLFFTFSIGAGISFFALASAWIWDRFFYRNKYLLFLFLALWMGSLLALNLKGFNLFITLYFLVAPPVVFAATIKSLSRLNEQNRRPYEVIHIVPVLVLALFLYWQMDGRMFIDFRDIFLLSNPVGSKINNFYYRYTLYPAEAFKSIDQKMLKTYRVEKKSQNTSPHALEQILISYDYIPIEGNSQVNLQIGLANDDYIFKNRGKPILRMSSKKFFVNPDKVIKEFAQKSDAYTIFRQLTFLSLLIGFPLAVYVIVQGLISFTLSLLFNIRTSAVIASALCFILCLALFISFQLNRSRDLSAENLETALNSDRWQNRVAALKVIEKEDLEIMQFQAYPDLLTSPHTAERYWIARALAVSRDPATYSDLLNFLNDTHRNVFSTALYALGKRGNKLAIHKIVSIIRTSDDWYSQWYAYKALRDLGWRQTKLN